MPIVAETKVRVTAQLGNVRQALAKRMLRVVIGLTSYIVSKKLSGNPLHRRSGNLSRAINYSVDEGASEIIGSVGVARQAAYGEVHEYGGNFAVPEHTRRSVLGNQYTVRGYILHMPERSFMRTSLRENNQTIREQLQAAVPEGIRQ